MRVRALAVEALANLLSEESCRTFAAQQNCLPPLIECLGSIHNELLVHSCRAVAALAQSKPLRHQIHSEGGLLPMLALCFIGNMYGLVRYHALRGIANMSKEEALRRDIIAHGIPARLSRLARHEDDMVDPAVRHLVASIFCNFSLAEVCVRRAGLYGDGEVGFSLAGGRGSGGGLSDRDRFVVGSL